MPIDVRTAESPGWWMQRLAKKLEKRTPRLEKLDSYFRGDPPLPTGAENAREAYKAFQRKARTNFAELIVEATRERMRPTGFRTGAADDENGDDEARRLWKGNDLDVEFADVCQSMLSMGDAYMIVGLGDDLRPVITGEDPRQVVTEHDPVRQRNVRAALKLFHDSVEQRDLAYLYLPGRVYVAYRDVKRQAAKPIVRFSPGAWDWHPSKGGADGQQLVDSKGNPLPTLMPVVRFRNKRGVGEFEPHIDVLDRINHMLLQRMVIATMQAFRQRALQVDPEDMPDEDEDGREIDYSDVLAADPGAVWKLPKDVTLWESQPTDLTPQLKSVSDDVQHLAAVTRTPLHYLSPDAANGSAEGASLSREGLVFKAEDRIVRAESGLVDVMHISFSYLADEQRRDRDKLKVIWAPAERRSLQERADASSKAGDLPWRAKMQEVWQFPPAVIDELEEQLEADLARGERDPAVAAAAKLTGADA